MILLTGAAGKTGRAVLRALAARSQPVRALVRRKTQIEQVEALGAREVVLGDLCDESDLRAALSGARAVYHIPPNVSSDEIQIGKLAIDAGRDVGVEHFVYHSVLFPQMKAMPHHWNKLLVEEHLIQSALPFTILQPAAYMQNVLARWPEILDGVYRIPYAVKTRLGMVDLLDVAEAAARVLTEAGHLQAIYDLAGPEVLTQIEVAQILSRVLNRPVRAETTGIEVWAREARQAGLGTASIEMLVAMFRTYERCGFWGNPRTLESLIRRAPTRFSAFAERAAAGEPLA